MQGPRSTVHSLPETFELDHGSSSNNPGVNQSHFWNNMLNPVDPQNLPDYLSSANETNATQAGSVTHEDGSLQNWHLGGPSASDHRRHQPGAEDNKIDHGWTNSLSIGAEPSLRLEEQRFEPANHIPLESVTLNLNSNQVASGPWFQQNSHSSDIPQNSNLNVAFVGNGGPDMESQLYKPLGPETEQNVLANGTTNLSVTASAPLATVDYLAEASNSRPSGSLGGRRLSCKRKATEGAYGQSSIGASPSFSQQGESVVCRPVSARHNAGINLNISGNPLEHNSSVTPHQELQAQRFSSSTREVATPDHYPAPPSNVTENSQRNFRLRINPVNRDSAPLNSVRTPVTASSTRRAHLLSSVQSSSRAPPFNRSVMSRPLVAEANTTVSSQAPSVPVLPRGMHPYPFQGVHSSRTGSSSNSTISGERSSAFRGETNSRSLARSTLEYPMFLPGTAMRHLAHDSTNLSLVNGSARAPVNVGSSSRIGLSSSMVQPTAAPPLVDQHNIPPNYSRRLASEFIRATLLASSRSESGGQSMSRPGGLAAPGSSHQMGLLSDLPNRERHQPSGLRSALRVDRHADNLLEVQLLLRSLSEAVSEQRSLLASEIRNVLGLMRRGENLRYEDVTVFDPSVFYGVADFHDRHRDMRLDVDNMSYEELLALEERIGNVNTGLSEEVVLKCLKQWKYEPLVFYPSQEVEPCCICQEEYREGDVLGKLDCGHDFHTVCIKQWLMQKNLCPICKKPAFT